MSDLSGAVAAILAATPMTPEGEVAHEWEYDTGLRDRAVLGPPGPVAERQAAAVRPAILRELADELEAREAPAGGKIWLIDARWLRGRADEIEETR